MRSLRRTLFALALALGATCALARTVRAGERTLVVEEIDGETWCSIRGVDLSIADLVSDVAERMELIVTGLETVPIEARADVYLENRRVSEALTYVLGLVEVRAERRANRLTLVPNEAGSKTATSDAEPEEEAHALLELASLAYLRVTRKFGDHPDVPKILLAQARISRDLDRPAAARSHYEELVNRFPFAIETQAALYELGALLMELGEYGPAAQEFAELLRFERGTDAERSARLQLAHCRAELGQYEDALLMLQALDSKNPPLTREERQERLYSQARFQIGLGQCTEALESLERADSFGITEGRVRRIALRLRAMALEGNARSAEASRAWLAYQAEVEGPDRGHALAQAARTALETGRGEDLLAVIFIGRLAARSGLADATGEYVAEAQRRLGLGDPGQPRDAAKSLERAAELEAQGLDDEAASHLDQVALGRSALTHDQALTFVELRARTLSRTEGLEPAIRFLRDELELWPASSDRKFIYVQAADLFSEQGRWQEEIEALQGKL